MSETTNAMRLARPGRVRRVVRFRVASMVLIVAGCVAVLMAIWPSMFSPYDSTSVDAAAVLQSPSAQHILGTDEAGADVWTRIVASTRLELLIAGGGAALALLLGLPLGLLAGYGGRLVDVLLSSVSSATLAFPLVLFAILVVASFGASTPTLVGLLGFLFFPRVFLLIRAQTKSLREREFVAALTVTGVSPARILFRHILPNTFGALFTLVPQLMAEAILVEAGLSYLGLGIQAPDTTWGTILRASKDYYVTTPTYAAVPGITITIAAALLMYAGHILSESADPRRRRSKA